MSGSLRLYGFGIVASFLILLSTVNAHAVRFVYSYDDNGRLLTVSKFGHQASGYSYDNAGNLLVVSQAESDIDSDTLPDAWELQYGLDPDDPADANIDSDSDGLDNIAEYAAGTDPSDQDTDNDGYSDGEEIAAGFDPLDPASHPAVYPVPAMGVSGVVAAVVLCLFAGLAALRRGRQGIACILLLLCLCPLSAKADALRGEVVHMGDAPPVNPEAPTFAIDTFQGPALPPGSPGQLLSQRMDTSGLGAHREGLEPDATPQAMTPMGAGDPLDRWYDELRDLARALRYDVDRIYEYVQETVEYEHYFGYLKGPVGTMRDGSGGNMDQCVLMHSLLTASGYEAKLAWGRIKMPAQAINDWLGLSNDRAIALKYFHYSGHPYLWLWGGTETFTDLDFYHMWVKVNIGGEWYVFDPSIKTHTNIQPVLDVAQAMGYDRAAFLSQAKAGSSMDPTGNAINNISAAAVKNAMQAHAGNLVAEIRTNHSSASFKEVIGGKTINPTPDGVRVTEHPYQFDWIQDFTGPDNLPDSLQAILYIKHHNLEGLEYCGFRSPDIYGKRFTLRYNAAHEPEIYLEGVLVATGDATPAGQQLDIAYKTVMPNPYDQYEGWPNDRDREVSFQVKEGGTYCIVNQWGEKGRNHVEYHRQGLEESIANGADDDSEEVMGQILAILAHNYMAQYVASNKIAEALSSSKIIRHYFAGVVGFDGSTYVDLPMGLATIIDFDDPQADTRPTFLAMTGRQSILESGVLEQSQGLPAVSTAELYDLYAQSGSTVFYNADSSTWSWVRPRLVNYSTAEINAALNYINDGYRLALPGNGDLGLGDWSGIGFVGIYDQDGVFASTQHISGNLNGGKGAFERALDRGRAIYAQAKAHVRSFIQSVDPIDMASGAFLYDTQDMAIGSGDMPVGLELERSYTSLARREDRGLGYGWTHAFDLTAERSTNGYVALGDGSAVDAAVAIAAVYIARDILTDSTDFDRLVLSQLIAAWLMERLVDNVVTVRQPDGMRHFTKLADGAYNPPRGNADQLEEVGGGLKLTTKFGAEMDFDAQGKLTTWRDLNDNTLELEYDAGRLTSVSNNFNRSLAFAYNGDDRLEQVSDGTGRSVSYGYDAQGRLTSFTDADDKVTTYAYDDRGRLASVFYPTRPTEAYVTNTYDERDRVKTQVNAENKTYRYYFSGYKNEEQLPSGHTRGVFVNADDRPFVEYDEYGMSTMYFYDGQLRITSTRYPETNELRRTFDAMHNVLIETRVPKSGSSEQPLTTTYTYHPQFNKPTSKTDPKDRVTDYTYDAKGNLERVDLPVLADGTRAATAYTYTAQGLMETETDPEGMVTRYEYDPLTGDRLSETKDHGRLNLTTGYTYTAQGDVATETDPRNNTTTYEYDAMRRLTRVTSPPPFNYVTKYAYDEEGRRIREERQTNDPQHPWQVFATAYTPMGEKATETDPEGKVTIYAYDANNRLWKKTDPEGRTTEYLYNRRGELAEIVSPEGYTVKMVIYTVNGKPGEISDANENTTTMQYDGHDRLKKTIYPGTGGSFEELTYDDAGNVVDKLTRGGHHITYQYDALDRLSGRQVPGATWGNYSYTYDLAGRVLDASANGYTVCRAYDTSGRLKSEKYEWFDGVVMQYEYDAADNLTRIDYPVGFHYKYFYDELNRLTDVKNSSDQTLAHYGYDELSRRTFLGRGNGAATTYGYDWADRATGIAHYWNGGNVILGYAHDDSGLIAELDVSNPGFEPVVPAPQNMAFTCNELNQVVTAGGESIAYQLAGTPQEYDGFQYHYDVENRLAKLDNLAAQTSSLSYIDGHGRKKIMTDGDGDHVYMFDHKGQVTMEFIDFVPTRLFVYGPGIDEPIGMFNMDGSGWHFYHVDNLGSTIALTKVNGDLAETCRYTAYGKPEQASTVGNPYLFTGRRYIADAGIYYYRARYYHPELRRFLEPDPLGYADGMNLYAYAGNNPVMYVDPMGTCVEVRGGFDSPLGGWKRTINPSIWKYKDSYTSPSVSAGMWIAGFKYKGGVNDKGELTNSLKITSPAASYKMTGNFNRGTLSHSIETRDIRFGLAVTVYFGLSFK